MKIQRGDILYVDLGVQYQGSMHVVVKHFCNTYG